MITTKKVNAFTDVIYKNIYDEDILNDIQEFIVSLYELENASEKNHCLLINEYLDTYSRHYQLVCVVSKNNIIIINIGEM